MAFNIVPVHSFNNNSDYYVIQVTGNTDPSKQYAHLSYMAGGDGISDKIIDGLGNNKPGWLLNDNILGYNYTLWYEACFKSGNNIVGTVIKSAPETINDAKKVSKGFTFAIDGNVSGGIEC